MVGPVTIKRMDHVGVVVDDLAGAVAFFADLGLELVGEATVEGRTVDRVVGLEGVRSDVAMMQTPDGHARLELCKFHTPPSPAGDPGAQSNALGIRHVTFEVEGIDDLLDRVQAHGAELVGELEQYENSWRLCYVRGPEGIIIELAERVG
jgi:catechol 2,3-dioxygenase-like lactoylglutathione lyase family enzyme